MDVKTNTLLSQFTDYLEKKIETNKAYKAFRSARIVHTALKENRITLEILLDDKRYKVFADIRELKDNPEHFEHLSGNLLDQLKALVNE